MIYFYSFFHILIQPNMWKGISFPWKALYVGKISTRFEFLTLPNLNYCLKWSSNLCWKGEVCGDSKAKRTLPCVTTSELWASLLRKRKYCRLHNICMSKVPFTSSEIVPALLRQWFRFKSMAVTIDMRDAYIRL